MRKLYMCAGIMVSSRWVAVFWVNDTRFVADVRSSLRQADDMIIYVSEKVYEKELQQAAVQEAVNILKNIQDETN